MSDKAREAAEKWSMQSWLCGCSETGKTWEMFVCEHNSPDAAFLAGYAAAREWMRCETCKHWRTFMMPEDSRCKLIDAYVQGDFGCVLHSELEEEK